MRYRGFTRGEAVRTSVAQCFIFVVLSAVALATPRPVHLKVAAHPTHPINGAACLCKVAASGELTELHGKWLEHEVEFESQDNGRSWITIAGTGFATKKGQYPLVLEGKS